MCLAPVLILISENQDKVFDELSQKLSKGIGLNWMIKTFLSFSLAIAGLLGTILLVQQNKLIEEQKSLMQNQDKLIKVNLQTQVESLKDL